MKCTAIFAAVLALVCVASATYVGLGYAPYGGYGVSYASYGYPVSSYGVYGAYPAYGYGVKYAYPASYGYGVWKK